MKGQRKYWLGALALALISVAIIWVVGLGEATEETQTPQENERSTLISNIKLLDAVIFDINQKYVDSVNVKEMARAGINGMMETLDPFSDLQDIKAHDRLMEMTEGKYEGLGMTISERAGAIIVISPIEGTPAYRMGLRAGDQIVKIDGKTTEGMTTEQASGLMRGERGTTVVLTIKREGVAELLEYPVERAIIELKNVPYYGVMDGGIGYVRLSKFSKDSGKEVKDAIEDLKTKGIKGLIFDLRSNGGGLLDQAVETGNLFLDQGKQIVYTQGRAEAKREFNATQPAVYPDDPLVVLVNDGTASASEIVSGAIQDWDRGVIIGNTTFGKGLVQQVFPMPNDTYLKLTIAKYYIPSGRCIQKPEIAKRQPVTTEAESEVTPDSVKTGQPDSIRTVQKEIFHTKGGRKVYGGGGVVPDVEVEVPRLKPIEYNLERQSMFFNFAVSYLAKHPNISKDFEVDNGLLQEFKQYLKEKNFTYKSILELDMEPLKTQIQKQEKSEMFSKSLAEMEQLIEKDKADDFEKSVEYIKTSLKRDILSNLYGERAFYEQLLLKTDPYIKKAFEILTNEKEYQKILKG
ncbi:MAG: S41 family peptidase [Candidatus Zixiibacteriota bacterium]